MTNRVIIKNIDKKRFFERFRFYFFEIDDYEAGIKEISKLEYLFLVRVKGGMIVVSKNKLNLKVINFKEFCELNEYIIFAMALKALGLIEYGLDLKSNGLFYVVKEYKNKIIALKFNLVDGVLTFATKTFIRSKKGNFKKISKRILPSKNGNFILKSDGKNQVDFMRFYVDKNFKNSKMYALYEVSKRLKEIFPEIEWEFEKVNFKTYKVSDNKKNKKTEQIINRVLNEIKSINIVNYTNSDISKLTNFLKEKNIDFKISTQIEDGYNITITHSPNSYNGNDPYHKDENHKSYIQNIIDKNLQKLDKNILEVLLKELIIKKEIKTKKLILPEHIPDKKFQFFLKKDDKVYGIEIEKDNLRFDIIPTITLKNGDFAIIQNENISIITKTKMHLIFDLEAFDKVKEKMNLRRNEFKIIEKLLGLKYTDNLYAVGIVGSPHPILKNGFPIREIITLKGESLQNEILEMMKEFFVNYKRLTIMPYAKKYIMEYYKL